MLMFVCFYLSQVSVSICAEDRHNGGSPSVLIAASAPPILRKPTPNRTLQRRPSSLGTPILLHFAPSGTQTPAVCRVPRIVPPQSSTVPLSLQAYGVQAYGASKHCTFFSSGGYRHPQALPNQECYFFLPALLCSLLSCTASPCCFLHAADAFTVFFFPNLPFWTP
jgi:hypothetical protein